MRESCDQPDRAANLSRADERGSPNELASDRRSGILLAALVRAGLVGRPVMRFCMVMGRGSHDRRRHQGSGRQNKSQRSDKALERGNHERVLRGKVEGQKGS